MDITINGLNMGSWKDITRRPDPLNYKILESEIWIS